MNKNQKIVAVVVASIICLMLLFPPFQTIREHGIFNMGYSFILTPPGEYITGIGEVNIGLLLVQWLAVIIAGTVAFFVLNDKKEKFNGA